MLRVATILMVVLCCSAAFAADARPDVSRAIAELSSPYLEARRRAAESLAVAGKGAESALGAAYPSADFRTKALILDVFRMARPEAGLPLVYVDLETPDRAVHHAQRRLVEAVHSRVRDLVTTGLLPAIRGVGYRLEERLRALPGPGSSARAALRTVSEDPRLAGVARRVADLVDAVDGVRRDLVEIRDSGSPLGGRRADDLLEALVILDVERALLAVREAGGDQGSYEGMFDTVGELVRPGRGSAVRVLYRMVTHREMPEPGVPLRRGETAPPSFRSGLKLPVVRRPASRAPVATPEPYRWSEPLPADVDEAEMRRYAADCLGEVADPMVGPALAEFFERIGTEPDVDSLEREYLGRAVASACAVLGEDGPLLGLIREARSNRFSDSYDTANLLGGLYAKLRRHADAEREFKKAIDDYPWDQITHYNLACVLARESRVGDALDSLRDAAEQGYGMDPRQIEWMERDRDLDNLRRSVRFRAFIATLKRRNEEDGPR